MLMSTRLTTALTDLGEVSVVFCHAKVDKLVYVHPPRGTCQLGVSPEVLQAIYLLEA